MPICHHCQEGYSEQELIHCISCGHNYCVRHKEPSEHDCALVIEKTQVQTFIERYRVKEISQSELEDYLVAQLEHNTKYPVMDILELFGQLGLNGERIFKILESYMVSDSPIKDLAAKNLITLFPERSIEPLEWVIAHEKSDEVLAVIYDLLLSTQIKFPPKLRAAIINKFKLKNLYYIEEGGVDPVEAPILSMIEPYLFKLKFIKAKLNFRFVGGGIDYFHYILNDAGKIKAIYVFLQGGNIPMLLIPKSLSFLKELEILFMNSSNVCILYDTLGNITSLKVIDLTANNITAIPESIGLLKNLRELHLGWNRIQVLPDSIGQLKELKVIDLNINDLNAFPPSLGQLKKLEVLNLHGNEIEALPDEIDALSSLRKLDLSYNSLTQFPKAILKLSTLEELDLSGNNFHISPERLSNLKSLKKLNL